jgi:hypothetical protein
LPTNKKALEQSAFFVVQSLFYAPRLRDPRQFNDGFRGR